MKILFICTSLEIGGIETYICRFSCWLKKKHPYCELHLLCKSGLYGNYEKDFRDAGVVLHSMKIGYFDPIKYIIFYKFLKINQYDAICDFTGDFSAWPIFIACIANIQKRIAFYRHSKETYIPIKYKTYYQKLLNFILRIYSTNLLSNSQDALNNYYSDYNTKKDKRFKIIRNGIPIPIKISIFRKNQLLKEIGVTSTAKIVLHVGSSSVRKNHIIMLKIAQQSKINNDNVFFLFVGRGVKEKYGPTASKLRLDNIKFLGERRDVLDLLQIADLFIFPSTIEGQPNAFLEAVVSGLPFIASDTATIREALGPFWNRRWLFNPHDEEHGYALLKDHMNSFYKDDIKFKELISWCKNNNNIDKRFEEFFRVLKENDGIKH